MPHPKLQRQPRVDGDIADLLDFIGRQPWGNSIARYHDIERAIDEILEGPELDDVSVRRRRPVIELRRHNTAQFAIIYAYFPPSPEHADGLVSIRAIRHSRLKQVFRGVRETAPRYSARLRNTCSLGD